MEWLRFTPESITALVQVILAALIAVYLFSLKNKSSRLWLLAFSLVGETAHHFIKLISFSVPALYQSATPLLGIANMLIYILLLAFAYDFRARLYPREARFVIRLAAGLGVIIVGYLLYVFVSAMPHDQIVGSMIMMYLSLAFLMITGIWTIIVLLRKTRHFARLHSDQIASEKKIYSRDIRACLAFAFIFGLKLLIIPNSFLSEVGVFSVEFRIYTNLILHIFYLSGLALVIVDHIDQRTSLQLKLVGLSLTSMFLILSIGGLSIYSTSSLLERSKQFIPDRQKLRFSPADPSRYTFEIFPYQLSDFEGEFVLLEQSNHVSIELNFPFSFFGEPKRTLFINRHGILSFDEPYKHISAPVFYLEQLSPTYKSTLNLGTLCEQAFIAPLYSITLQDQLVDLRIKREPGVLSIQWIHFAPVTYTAISSEPSNTTFLVQLYENGTIDISYELIDVFLHKGLVGLYSGEPGEVQHFTPASLTQSTGSTHKGLILDLGRHFRTFVHKEVLPLVWLILWSIPFIALIFPLALRASVFRPLDHLLEGVRRIDKGKLDDHVPVIAQDEIGEVAKGFNTMMDSLNQAHRKLVEHADQLEDEVELAHR